MQLDLFGGVPFVRGSDTSRAAAKSIEGIVGRLNRLILHAVADSREHGMTCDEAEVTLNLRHQTCSSRITHLQQTGAIVDSGRRRLTRSRRKARVYVIPRYAPNQ